MRKVRVRDVNKLPTQEKTSVFLSTPLSSTMEPPDTDFFTIKPRSRETRALMCFSKFIENLEGIFQRVLQSFIQKYLLDMRFFSKQALMK